MGIDQSHSNTDPAFLGQLADVYNRACKSGMACNLRNGGAPSMFNDSDLEVEAPAAANKGPAGLDLG